MSCITGSMSLVIVNFNISIQRHVGTSSSEEKLLSEGNFPYLGDHAINIQSRTRKKVNYKPKVKRPSLAESIGPIVVPQGESFRTQTSYDLKTIKNQ